MFDISFLLQHWYSFLRGSEALIGLPLLGAGVALVMVGWRLWPVASFISLGLVGALVGQALSGSASLDLLWAGSAAIVFGLGSVMLPQYSSTVLGGIVGGAFAACALQTAGVVGATQWAIVALAFAGAAAWAFTYRHQVVVVVTSVEGGVLFASGVAVMLPEVPWLHGFFRSMTATSPFMIGFFVIVPAVVGVLLQQADSNRSSCKAAR